MLGVARSSLASRLSCAPGNGGIAQLADCVDIAVNDFDGIIAYCRDQAVDFVIVGPEDPLVGGLVDRLEAANILAFGPNERAAILEGSKVFTKNLCKRTTFPPPPSNVFPILPRPAPIFRIGAGPSWSRRMACSRQGRHCLPNQRGSPGGGGKYPWRPIRGGGQ